jgi:O-methyltransferase involved in polyketide biosynthesis
MKSVLDGTSKIEGVEKLLQQVSKAAAPWMFGIDPTNIASFLTENKLSLLEDVGASEYEERYLKPHGRNLTGFAVERFVCAEV